MSNARFLSTHLEFPRREQFRAQRDEILRTCGSRTRVLSARVPVTPMGAVVLMDAEPGATDQAGFLTVAGSVTHHLDLGYNTIGRHQDNHIVLSDEMRFLSRRHCAIVIHSNCTAQLFDLASLNGTFLNGCRVSGSAPLRSGDVVRLGKHFAFSVVLYDTLGN